MRVLISGVTSDLGRAFARAALGAGHELTGVDAEKHRDLAPEVAFTAGDAATAESLVAGMDVVVHLSPVEREVPGSGGIPALRRMATAAARHGIRFVAPIAHGPDAADADRVVRDCGTRHVVVRTAPLGGRLLDWQACRTIATMLTAPRDTQWRLVHTDDLIRFLLYAITSDRTGVVTLAAQDIVTAGAAREALRGVSARGIARWPDMSTSDRKGTARDWGFECGWTTADVVADLARGARGRRLAKDGAIELVTRLPIPAEPLPRRRPPEDGTPLSSVALPSMAVESDDRIDSRYPIFSAQQTAELFPGPLTPLSIDVHSAGLRAAGRTLARMAGLPGPVADEWEGRGHTVFGHHVYAGVSAAAAAPLPGWSTGAVVEAHLGPRADDDLYPLGEPEVPTGLRGFAMRMGARSRFVRIARRYRAAVRDYTAAAATERLAGFEGQTDAVLAVRARLLADRLAEGWTLTQLGELVAHAAARPLRRRAKGDVAALGRGADVALEPTFPAIAGLADLLRADEELRSLAEWGDLEAVRQKSPEFGAALDAALTRIGHRGPNEAELSCAPFADRPELVFTAALAASRKPAPQPPTPQPSTGATPTATEPTTTAEPKPTTTDPTSADPALGWPTAAEPTSADPTTGWPTERALGRPATGDSTHTEPNSGWPTTAEPPATDSAAGWPTTAGPTPADPTAGRSTTAGTASADSAAGWSTTAGPTPADRAAGWSTTAGPTPADPTAGWPTTAGTASADSAAGWPTTADPTSADPAAGRPTTAEPAPADSASWWPAAESTSAGPESPVSGRSPGTDQPSAESGSWWPAAESASAESASPSAGEQPSGEPGSWWPAAGSASAGPASAGLPAGEQPSAEPGSWWPAAESASAESAGPASGLPAGPPSAESGPADPALGWRTAESGPGESGAVKPGRSVWPARRKPSPVPRRPTESGAGEPPLGWPDESGTAGWPDAESEPAPGWPGAEPAPTESARAWSAAEAVPPAAEPAAEAESTSDESAVDSPVPAKPKRKFAEKLAIAGRRQHELAMDATIRYTSELRLLVREWGRRQVHAGRLVDVDDAFFLTLDELLSPPADVLKRVDRRRAEHERLVEVRMPTVVNGSWRPEVIDYPMPEGKQLHGVGVSAGVVEGPVRVLTETGADIELGEVVVVRAADVGHVAMLGPAAAVVTDVGGPLSRVAVVARELGVPCVTGTRDASARLRPGTIVRVDGTSGDVTVLTPR